MKQYKYVFIIIVLATITIIFGHIYNQSKLPATTPYNRLISQLDSINVDDIQRIKEDGDNAIIYIGREHCPYCESAAEVLISLTTSVKYLDTQSLQKDADKYLKLIELLKNDIPEIQDGLMIPIIINIKEGQIKNYHIGTLNSDETGKLSTSQKKQLKKIYINLMEGK